jgi:hypothetical protein
MLFIISIEGEQPKTVSIDQETFTIGRSPKASIQVENECISRIHVQIRKNESGTLFITDNGSSNGTFINNERLAAHEEVQWHTFFPLNLSQKILITLISSTQETSERKVQYDERPKDLRENTSRTKTATIARKAPTPPVKKKYEKNPFIIPVLITLAMGYFLYDYYSTKEYDVTDVSTQEKSVPPTPKVSTELSNKVTELMSQDKCLTETEKNYCNLMNMATERFEGVLKKDRDFYIFLNFDYRLQNVLFDPSFSFADKKEQVTYLMVFFALREETRNFLQNLDIKEIFIVDTSSAPSKTNQVLKMEGANLFKLSSTDIETIKTMVLKKDYELYKNVITPIIQVESAY